MLQNRQISVGHVWGIQKISFQNLSKFNKIISIMKIWQKCNKNMLKIYCIFILFMYFGRRSFEFIGYNLQIICLISQSLWWILYVWWILSQNGHVQSFLAVQGNCPGCAGLPPITLRDLVGTLAIIIITIIITSFWVDSFHFIEYLMKLSEQRGDVNKGLADFTPIFTSSSLSLSLSLSLS